MSTKMMHADSKQIVLLFFLNLIHKRFFNLKQNFILLVMVNLTHVYQVAMHQSRRRNPYRFVKIEICAELLRETMTASFYKLMGISRIRKI